MFFIMFMYCIVHVHVVVMIARVRIPCGPCSFCDFLFSDKYINVFRVASPRQVTVISVGAVTVNSREMLILKKKSFFTGCFLHTHHTGGCGHGVVVRVWVRAC